MDDQYLNNRLFEGSSRNLLEGFDLPMTERRYPPGEVVFAEGDPGKHMYLVGSGSVRTSKEGRRGGQETLGFLKPGDFFGEIALLEDTPRSARQKIPSSRRLMQRVSSKSSSSYPKWASTLPASPCSASARSAPPLSTS
jgi:CRP-like cAMP-binding protein